MALVEAMHGIREIPPNVDMALAALGAALDLLPGAVVGLFALGRSAGWVAHVIEQYDAGYLLRPRARYVG
jgi:citrate synthase